MIYNEKLEKENCILLEGFLAFHREEFKKFDENFELISLIDHQLSTQKLSKTGETEKKNYKDKIINFLMELFTSLEPNDVKLLITSSRIVFYQFNDHWKALKHLNVCQNGTTSFLQKYIIKGIIYDIKEQIGEKTKKEDLEVQKLIEYEKIYEELIKTIEKTTELCLKFWTDLVKTKPDSKLLVKLALKVNEQNLKMKKIQEEVKEERLSAKFSLLYAEYQDLILNQDEKSFELLRNVEKFQIYKSGKEFINEAQLENILQNKNFEALIVVSVIDFSELGNIKNSFGDLEELLGIKDLIDISVEDIIPIFFRGQHKKIITEFFNTKKIDTKFNKRDIWFLDEDEYLRQMKATFTPRKNLEGGLEFYVVISNNIQQNQENRGNSHEVLIRKEDGLVVGVTENCYQNYGISSSILKNKNKQLYAEDIFPQFQERYKGKDAKIELDIDTRRLAEDYLITDNISNFEFGSEEEDVVSNELLKDEVESVERRKKIEEKFKIEKTKAQIKTVNFGQQELISIKFIPDVDYVYFKSEKKIDIVSFDSEKNKNWGEGNSSLNPESLMEKLENEKIVEDEFEKLKEEKIPVQATYLRCLIFWILFVFFWLYLFEFVMKHKYESKLKATVEYFVDIEKRGLIISRTGFLSSKIHFLTQINDENLKSKIPDLVKELHDLSSKLDEVEFKASNARLFFHNEKGNSHPFINEDGEKYGQGVYRYISSLSALIDNYKDPEFYKGKNFAFIQNNYLESLRKGGGMIETEFYELIKSISEWAKKLRVLFMIYEQALRIITASTYFVSVYLILDFDQKGFKILSFLKKKTIVLMNDRALKMKKKIKEILKKKFGSGKKKVENFQEDNNEDSISRNSYHPRLNRNRDKEGSEKESQEQERESLNKRKRKIFRKNGKKNDKMSNKRKIKDEPVEENMGSSDENYSEEEFEFEERSKILHYNQSGRKLLVVLSVIPAGSSIFFWGYILYLFEMNVIQNSIILADQIKFSTQSPKLIDNCLNLAYHDFLHKNEKYTNDDGIFNEYIESAYSSIKSFKEIDKYAFDSENFIEKYESIRGGNLCQNLKKYRNIEECQNIPVVGKSIYTVSIFTLETLRKYSSLNKEKETENFEILKSADFQELEKIEKFALDGYSILQEELQKSIDGSYSFIKKIDLIILLIWNSLYVTFYYLLELIIVSKVKGFLNEVKVLLVMVPVSFIHKNKNMMDYLLKEKKKRRRRRSRKSRRVVKRKSKLLGISN